MKAIRIFGNSFKDAFRSVFRNFNLSIASITCSTITLILVAIALIISINVNEFTRELKDELTIVVFINRDATAEDATTVGNQIKVIPNVDETNIEFLTKDDVKLGMQEKYEIFNSVMDSWTDEDNFLQMEYRVKVEDVALISDTAKQINELEHVDVTKYGEEMVDQLVTVFDVVEKVSIVIVGALILVTAFLISNTIKLTIYSRKNEIEIMRLIGASNFVIRMPFVIEGFFLGMIGSIIPIVVSIYGYFILFEKLGGTFYLKTFALKNPSPFIFLVSLIILGIGCVVGMLGSFKAVRKYLKI